MATSAKSPVQFKSPLHEMVSTTATDFWNDSCSIEELTYAIEHGAVGATSNPTIVGEVLEKAIEEATAAGVNVNATVSFTVPQVIAVAEAVELGLRRREAAGEDTATMRPVATMMIGRLDDWVEVLAEREGVLLTPGTANWAGIACFKRAYPIFR